LGKDYSGNGNNWTPNNFSVTAGAGNDSLVDVPTPYGVDTGVGGTVRGNYAVLNPLKSNSPTQISNGNLTIASAGASYTTGVSTISPSSGTYYMEMTCAGANNDRPWAIGLVESDAANSVQPSSAKTYTVSNGSGSTVAYYVGASLTATLSTAAAWVAGDVISLAWNVDSGKFWVGLNGVWYPSTNGGTVASNSDVAAGNFPTFSISYSANTNPLVFPAFFNYGTLSTVSVNFGQRPFAYTAPSGFKALCTQNLPTPTIGATTATQAGKFFNPVLYTGTGATNSITGVGFQPDWVWIKSRNDTYNPQVYDVLRGTNNRLVPASTNAEFADTDALTSFNSDGFTSGAEAGMNASAITYVAWNWKANGSGSTNTAGSITSTVSANTTSGFSVVTYTGNATSNQTFGHGLGAKVDFAIIKSRSAVSSPAWMVWHRSVCSGNGKALALEETNAIQGPFGTPIWDSSNTSTQASSTTFTIGANTTINASGATYVAYCFAEVAGYSAFGSFTGNGSTDGAFVYTGFRPAFVMLKASSTGGAGYNWGMFDNDRLGYNSAQRDLRANSSNAEGTDDNLIDFLSSGFKIRSTSGGFGGGSGVTYIYMAFADNPFKYSLAR
jgi:hypothetical protein